MIGLQPARQILCQQIGRAGDAALERVEAQHISIDDLAQRRQIMRERFTAFGDSGR